MMEEMRNGLTAEAADCWVPPAVTPPELGDPDFKDAWVAATVEDKRPKRPLEATTWDARTSAGEASTLQVAVTAECHTCNKEKKAIKARLKVREGCCALWC